MAQKIKTLNEYQELTNRLSQFKKFGITLPPLIYFTMGLSGETGEVAEKVKKLYRDESGELDSETKDLLTLELGDVLWYLAQLASTIGVKVDSVASLNVEKLESRLKRDKIRGNGDKR